jgi:prepilin-type N-terminal cleavage/methylation domain-containing protein
MKSPRCHYSGFTLVELLVVIAIIAILAAVLSVSAGSVINAAKRTKASNTAIQIQTAITNYYTEYGVYPLTASQQGTGDALEGLNGAVDPNEQLLFFALCGNINPYAASTPANNTSGVSNTRNIAFLTPKKSEVDANGVPFNPFSTSGAPVYFSIAIDADYSGILGDTGGVLTNMPDFVNWKSGTTMVALANGLTQPAAVWTCCDPTYVKTWSQSTSPSLWVHTY